MLDLENKLSLKLDRVFDTEVVFENTEGVVFTRTEWMSSDPEVVNTLATTTSQNTFWKNLRKIATETGDASTLEAIKNREPWLMQQARREARMYAPELLAITPKQTLPGKLQRPSITGPRPEQFLGKSKEEIEAYYAKRREAMAKQGVLKAKKKYYGDTLYGLFLNDQMVKGGFKSEEDAEIEMADNPDKYPEGYRYEIKPYENQKSLSKLRETYLPLQNGWNVDEVVAAMMPYLYHTANKFKSDKVPREDLVQQGAIGIMQALETDQGKSPFTAWAMKYIKGQMLHLATTGGVIKGSQKGDVPEPVLQKAGLPYGGAATFKQKGGLVGYRVIWFDENDQPDYRDFGVKNLEAGKAQDPGYIEAKKYKEELAQQGLKAFGPQDIRGGMSSASTPVRGKEGEGSELGDMLKATKTRSPAYIARQAELVDHLIQSANLSAQQEKALRLAFGLDEPMAGIRGTGQFREPESLEAGREPGAQAGEKPQEGPKSRAPEEPFARGMQDVADIMGISKKRARDHILNATMKLCRSAAGQRSKFCQQLLGKTEEQPESAEVESLFRTANDLMLVESHFRSMMIKWIIKGDLNGAFIQD